MEDFQIIQDAIVGYGKPVGYFVAGVVLAFKYVVPYLKKLRKK